MADRSPPQAPIPWRVAVVVDEVPEEGRHFDLIADAQTRAAVAEIAGLRDLPRLEAHFDVKRHGNGGLRVDGKVSADVGQTCVVTLEPLTNEIVEDVALVFAPAADPETMPDKPDGAKPDRDDEAEPLIAGTVDLGSLATEFLLLGLDPYPRKPGVEFQPPQDSSSDEGPFAALAALKKGPDAR
jgi:uncharacterized metal-binding protein YceD (DUF177 family)